MLKTTAKTWRLPVGLLALSACCFVFAQRGGPGGNQAQPNPQDRAVKVAGEPANPDQSGKPLDEQKSAPVQVITRRYDLNALTHEPKVPETVFRGRVLWVQKCAYCHDGLGTPTYKTLGPWLDQDLVTTLTDDLTKQFIESGTPNMPGFKYALSSTEEDDLLNFLKTIPASAKPTAAQLAGRNGENISE
jgi:mono/diheme cytochrome c family protein